jgi:DNA-binding transcriptional regulator LsrR (DeoR family)
VAFQHFSSPRLGCNLVFVKRFQTRIHLLSTIYQNAGFFDISTIDQLRARGAVGDISGRYFDINGNRILGDVENGIIGLTWDDLQKLENVVAVARGSDKTAAILGALRTGLLDYLIIDDRTLSEVEKADAE